jgi:hypothetical protein
MGKRHSIPLNKACAEVNVSLILDFHFWDDPLSSVKVPYFNKFFCHFHYEKKFPDFDIVLQLGKM